MSDSCSVGVAVGIVVGAFLTLIIMMTKYPLGNKANVVINACQVELPRNQYCVLTAEPKVSNE